MRRVSRFYSKLEPCTKKYAMSLVDPTSEASRGACIPSGFPIPSQKVRCFHRGVVTTNTTGTGLGFIIMKPAIANDIGCVIHTTGGVQAATSTTAFNNATLYPQASPVMSKLPYSAAQLLSTDVEGRFISGCIRIRYTGKESTRAGTITAIETPDHEDIYPMNLATVDQYENARKVRPSGEGEWTTVCWSGPARTSELEYVNRPDQIPNTHVLGLIIQGGDANVAQVYDYECWINAEYIGRITTGKTKVEIDQQGVGKALEVVKTEAGQGALGPEVMNKVINKITNIMGSKDDSGTARTGFASNTRGIRKNYKIENTWRDWLPPTRATNAMKTIAAQAGKELISM